MRLWTLALVMAGIPFACGAAESAWPFDQPPNVAVITVKQIVHRQIPILRVTHDADDHGWQFLNPAVEPRAKNASIVSLEQIVNLDPSVVEIADLPIGWSDSRRAVGEKWVREKLPAAENGK